MLISEYDKNMTDADQKERHLPTSTAIIVWIYWMSLFVQLNLPIFILASFTHQTNGWKKETKCHWNAQCMIRTNQHIHWIFQHIDGTCTFVRIVLGSPWRWWTITHYLSLWIILPKRTLENTVVSTPKKKPHPVLLNQWEGELSLCRLAVRKICFISILTNSLHVYALLGVPKLLINVSSVQRGQYPGR